MTSDLVKCPYTAGGGISEELAVQQHDSGDEVESKEHGYRKHHVQIRLRLRGSIGEGEPRPPHEFEVTRHRMNRRNDQLQRNEQHPLYGHGDPPVIRTIVNDKELRGRRIEMLNKFSIETFTTHESQVLTLNIMVAKLAFNPSK